MIGGRRPVVCIDCRYLSGRVSGIGNVVAGLVRHAPELAPDLDFVLLKHKKHSRPIRTGPNVRERATPYVANGPVSMWALSRLCDLSDIDLFHATSNILPAGLKMATLTTVHDVMWLTRPDLAARAGFRGLVDTLFYRHGIRRALRRSSAIGAISESTATDIRRVWPAARSRLHVTPSGICPSFAPAVRSEASAPSVYALSQRPYVLCVGQNAPYKNHLLALDAFHHAFRESPEVQMVFVHRGGAGAERIRGRATSLGIEDRLHILACIPDESLKVLYSYAIALCHPSLYEGFGNPIGEAMACGCPVVTSNLSAMPEVAGGAALLVDPNNAADVAGALRRVRDDPALAAWMRREGLERSSRLSIRRFAQANVALYRRVLAAGA